MLKNNRAPNFGVLDVNIQDKDVIIRQDQLEIYRQSVEKTAKQTDRSVHNR